MNYRPVLSFTAEGAIICRIETTHAAADPGTNVFGSLKIARAHLEMWIDRRVDELRDAKRHWRSVPERKLPNDEPNIEQSSEPLARAAPEPPAAGGGSPAQPAAGDDMPEIPANLRREAAHG